MRFLSWNVQYGKSNDGSADFLRTLEHIRSLGKFDVICLQELARNMTEYCEPGQSDHLALTQQYFPEFNTIWGTGFSWPATDTNPRIRQEFGNVSLINPRLLDYKTHLLPLPATPNKKQMQRVAVETVIESKIGPLSIINTHLAYHDSGETQLQVEYLHQRELERLAHHRAPKLVDTGTYQQGYLASARILCGDFNLTPDTSHYQYQVDSGWRDAWSHCNGSDDRLPTCGISDPEQWPEGAHCRDYFWLSHELQSQTMSISVDTETRLSDHQPVILEISI